MKISTFIIGTILAALFMTAFTLILSDANDKYDLSTVNYDSTDMAVFKTLNKTYNLSKSIQNRTLSQKTNKNALDVIGGFIADARDTLLLSSQSVNTFSDMSNAGMEKANVDPIFRTALMTIILIVVFLGVIASAVVGRDL